MGFREKVKKEVLRRAAFCCCVCKSNMLSVEVHHIVPQKDGGSDAVDNAAPLCPTCHKAFGNDPDKRKRIREIRDWWYGTVERMYPDNIMPIKKLDDIHSEIKALRFDRDKCVEDLKAEYPFLKAGEANSRPALFITVTCASTGRFQDTIGLIDPSASSCCVPMGFAEVLGLDLIAGKRKAITTASGVTEAYEHECGVKIWNTN